MMRAIVFWAGVLGLAACASGPGHEVKPFPAVVARKEAAAVRDAVRQALLDRKIPVESAEDTAVRSSPVEGNGFSWTVVVLLYAGAGAVTLEPSLVIDRNRPFRPVRNLLTNMGKMTEEEESGRATDTPEDQREAAIRKIEERVRALVRDLETRLADPER